MSNEPSSTTARDREPLVPTLEQRALHCLGYFGHYLHVHAGGRCGKQRILAKLLTHGGRLTQRELQELFPISAAALSEVLSKLEAEGLISRTRSERDRRQLVIELTDAGAQSATTVTEGRRLFESRCLAALADDEKEAFVSMLERVSRDWRGTAPQVADRPRRAQGAREVAR
ncbi:MarR family winged helix-turn-helix transcriptional regulator [Olsenella sp. HMSC062G07]|uniref:MarR family winged helix-turn-helix transcriptional regulator n=1 Tax=Olsenella sp. HMSC062G07 TaxID=1739330 RepID=UPI0008A17209|nr:MarR family transcriptional regulator [Olsenella sp. HMSC062G07]